MDIFAKVEVADGMVTAVLLIVDKFVALEDLDRYLFSEDIIVAGISEAEPVVKALLFAVFEVGECEGDRSENNSLVVCRP